jgi:2-C-methyl-D-erythritol 2,4-cyclodiphosphate synthase
VRVGIGWDRHRLVPGRPCILGGVAFPESAVGPLGHSDGDAVCHAIVDALLGAAGLGDIGRHFPDTDPTWSGADSTELLARTVTLVAQAGYRVGNVDCTVITETPRIAPRQAAMTGRLAAVLGIPPEQVSIKATRGEGLGPEGRGEGLAVVAVALLEKV